jgi:hypothetical protein
MPKLGESSITKDSEHQPMKKEKNISVNLIVIR